MQLLAAGSTFDLRFELAISGASADLREALATALDGLEHSEITLGARKRRGFGQVSVKDWKVWKYNLGDRDGLLAWLESGDQQDSALEQKGETLTEKLSAAVMAEDAREMAHLEATFALDSTLMIRSGFGQADSGPDLVHLHSPRPGREEKRVPVIPGTSWAGALRQRALKIARTLSSDDIETSRAFVDAMFGPAEIKREDSKNAWASRVSIAESEIEQALALVITRVKIDRFTGGSFESALFSEQPAIGTPETRVKLDLILRSPGEAELGLLLLLLKDLWTGDLPIGGESSIGRGRLKGVKATLKTPEGQWDFQAEGDQVNILPNAEKPEEWVQIFNKKITKAQVSHA
jgi:CRISPR/Cas system CSM-associated protein Csm3 (group 7 of RAMP superfamily)